MRATRPVALGSAPQGTQYSIRTRCCTAIEGSYGVERAQSDFGHRLVHGQRSRGCACPAADRSPSVRSPERLGRRPASSRRRERLPGLALVGRLRRVAPRHHRGRDGRDQGQVRVRVRRFPPTSSVGPHRVSLPRRRVAPQGRRAGRPRAAAAPRRHQRLTVAAARAPSFLDFGGTICPVPGPSLDLIRGIPLFAEADDRFLERLAQEFTERTFRAGEKIADEGRPGRTFIVIETGEVTVTVHGREVGRLGPGDAFGEIALSTSRPAARRCRPTRRCTATSSQCGVSAPLSRAIRRWRGPFSRPSLSVSAPPRHANPLTESVSAPELHFERR
jgi:hypothetical protein